MISQSEYLKPMGRSRNASIYSYLDALEIGETWEVPSIAETERTVHAIRCRWQLRRPGRLIRAHSTSRGFMFVRIE